jgi:hypothetical protein
VDGPIKTIKSRAEHLDENNEKAGMDRDRHFDDRGNASQKLSPHLTIDQMCSKKFHFILTFHDLLHSMPRSDRFDLATNPIFDHAISLK